MLSLVQTRILSIINTRKLSHKIELVKQNIKSENELSLAYLLQESIIPELKRLVESARSEYVYLIRKSQISPSEEAQLKSFTIRQSILQLLSSLLITNDIGASNSIELPPALDLEHLQRIYEEAFIQLQRFKLDYQVPEETLEIAVIELIAEKLGSSPVEDLVHKSEAEIIKKIETFISKLQGLSLQDQLRNLFYYFFVAKDNEYAAHPLFQEIKRNLQEIAFILYNPVQPPGGEITETWIEQRFKPITCTFPYPKPEITLQLRGEKPLIDEKQFNREFLSGLRAFCSLPQFPLDENSSNTTPIKNQQALNTLEMFMKALEKIGSPLRINQLLAQLLLQTREGDTHTQVHTIAFYKIYEAFLETLNTETSHATLRSKVWLQPIYISPKTNSSIDVIIPCFAELSSLAHTSQGRIGYPEYPAIAGINFGAVITFNPYNPQQLEISCFADVLIYTALYPKLRSTLENFSKSNQHPPSRVPLNITQHFSHKDKDPATTGQVNASYNLAPPPLPSKQASSKISEPESNPQQGIISMYKRPSTDSISSPYRGGILDSGASYATPPTLKQQTQSKSYAYTADSPIVSTPSTTDSLKRCIEDLDMGGAITPSPKTPRSGKLPPTPQSHAHSKCSPVNLGRHSHRYGDEEPGVSPLFITPRIRPIPFPYKALSTTVSPGPAPAEKTPKPVKSFITSLSVKRLKQLESDSAAAGAAPPSP
jgi:hypothetical protein